MHIHTYTNTRACTCAFACACGEGEGREERGVVVGGSVGGWVGECVVPSAVSLRIKNGAQQLPQVKRMIGGLGNVLFSTCSQTLNG